MPQEVCPFHIVRPAVPVPRYAALLVPELLDPERSYKELDIPPLPQKIQAQDLTPEQRSQYKSDAAFAIHAAHWAKWLREERQELRLRSVPYIDKTLEPANDRQEIVDTALVRYGRALRWLATEHRNDPELYKVRRFRREANREVPIFEFSSQNITNLFLNKVRSPLWNDHRRGVGGFIETLRTYNSQYFKLGLDSQTDERTVLNNSLPDIRAQAVVALAANRVVHREVYVAHRNNQLAIGTDIKMWREKFAELPDYVKQKQHRVFGDRTNNACPALAPIPGYSDKGAIELQLEQMLEIFEDQGVFSASK